MKLLIVESPNKKQTIAKYLGAGWRVEASMGHVCDLPIKEIGVQGPNFKPKYELTERGKRTIQTLLSVAEKAESVYLAMDPDREGEAIAGHIAKYLKGTVGIFHRVIFNEITEKVIKNAVANPRKLDKALFDAQQARRVIDRLVGYQVSPRLSNLAGERLSAGRVQSVAIRLLVERERSIRIFQSTEHLTVRLHFNNESYRWFANWDTTPFLSEDAPYIVDKSLAERIAHIKNVVVLSNDKKTTQRKAPPPFITTTLQKAASIQFGVSAEDTMRLAQTLFEKGLISYHRTDNPNLSKEAIAAIQTELKNLGFGEHIAKSPNMWKAKTGAQEAHEAIRPTEMARVDTGLPIKEQKLYELIRLRALASQLNAACIEVTTIVVAPPDRVHDIGGKTPRFIAKGNKALYQGWRLLIPQDLAIEKEKNDEEPLQGALPNIEPKTALIAHHSEVLELKTQAPKRYSEPALITKLEKEGIGRPSTYAAILSNIKNRGYVVIQSKCFVPTPTAETIYDALMDKFQFMEIEYTRLMESALDDIAGGKQDYLSVVSAVDKSLQESLNTLTLVEAEGKVCPLCAAPMRKIKGMYGEFFGCTKYREGCKGTIAISQDAKQDNPTLLQTIVENPCPKCQKPLRRIKGKNGFFWSCTGYNHGCTVSLDDKKGKPARYYPCPACKNPLRQIKTKGGKYWVCSGYKNGCKQHLEDQRGRPVIKKIPT